MHCCYCCTELIKNYFTALFVLTLVCICALLTTLMLHYAVDCISWRGLLRSTCMKIYISILMVLTRMYWLYLAFFFDRMEHHIRNYIIMKENTETNMAAAHTRPLEAAAVPLVEETSHSSPVPAHSNQDPYKLPSTGHCRGPQSIISPSQ